MKYQDVLAKEPAENFYQLSNIIYKDDPFYRPNHHVQEINKLWDVDSPRPIMIENIARMVLIPSNEYGIIGYFEATNNQEAVNLLFQEAVDYFRALGIKKIVGPMNGDTWHSYRFNCGPYTEPFLFEPYNPSYYPRLWENFGFDVIANYYSKRIEDISKMPHLLEKKYEQAIKKGFYFRSLDHSKFDEELELIYHISCDAFEDNFLYSEIEFEDFIALYKPAKNMLVPQLIQFVMSPDQDVVGFFFGIPDSKETFNAKTVAIVPEYRQHGLAQAMQYLVYQNALRLGFKAANLCLIHEDNVSDKINKEFGDIIRTYKLYGLNINEL